MTERALPLPYLLVLFLVLALLNPVAGLVVGDPFTDPSVAELLVLPAVLVVFAAFGHFLRSRRGDAGVVDERDVRNVDRALEVTGIVLLAGILAVYVRSAVTDGVVPGEVGYLAAAGVGTVVLALAGTELHQRL